ncbi:MAG: indole-3-glycerol-phosphate synthase, partial [Oscillospiraceae bacterium]|nr:indole-3-glycerol-phosphate synthase [Oscillospiraceae bacterium]
MILDDIVKQRRIQLRHEMQRCSLANMKKRAEQKLSDRTPLSLAKALKKDTLSCICEVKKASPSKGLIREDFHPADIAAEYAAAGADAISCLTEEHYFQGSASYLRDIAQNVNLPILRKDFVIDEYMLYEARAIGASAVLLIAAVLDDARLRAYFELAHELGLDCLVEVHT